MDCVDIDECALDLCTDGRTCLNFMGGYTCLPHFKSSGYNTSQTYLSNLGGDIVTFQLEFEGDSDFVRFNENYNDDLCQLEFVYGSSDPGKPDQAFYIVDMADVEVVPVQNQPGRFKCSFSTVKGMFDQNKRIS